MQVSFNITKKILDLVNDKNPSLIISYFSLKTFKIKLEEQ